MPLEWKRYSEGFYSVAFASGGVAVWRLGEGWKLMGVGLESISLVATDAAGAQAEAEALLREWVAGVAAGLGYRLVENKPTSQAEHLLLCVLDTVGGEVDIPWNVLEEDYTGWVLTREEESAEGLVRLRLEMPAEDPPAPAPNEKTP